MAEPQRTGAGRVLVVDDDPTVSEVVAHYLRHAGFDVRAWRTAALPWHTPWPTRRTWSCWT